MNAQNHIVSFPDRNVIIENGFREIEKQTGYVLSFGNVNMNTAGKVRLTHHKVTMVDALDQLLAQTPYTYIIGENKIIIVSDKIADVDAIITNETGRSDIGAESFVNIPETVVEKPMTVSRTEVADNNMPFEYPELSRTTVYSHTAGNVSGKPAYTRSMPFLAIKTNLLYGIGTLTPNIKVELGLTPKSTIDLSISYNGWDLDGSENDNKKFAHWIGAAEYRYWLCERFNGHFIGAHVFGGYYNISGHKIPMIFESNADDYRYRGNVFGAGVSYGYQLMLGRKWNLEFNGGFGVGFMKYDKYKCVRCGDKLEKDKNRTFFGPTKLGITLAYIIK